MTAVGGAHAAASVKQTSGSTVPAPAAAKNVSTPARSGTVKTAAAPSGSVARAASTSQSSSISKYLGSTANTLNPGSTIKVPNDMSNFDMSNYVTQNQYDSLDLRIEYLENNQPDLSGFQLKANISQDMDVDFGSTTKYPSVAAVQNAITSATSGISGVEYTVNKVTSISGSSTDTQYPSAKAVYNAITSATTNITNNIASDLADKQDKTTGVTAGNVATWASDGNGKFQTAGEVGIINAGSGITSGATGLTTGKAVYEAIDAASIGGTVDISGKQDKATGVTAGNVALWASDGDGKFQTAGEVGIINAGTGITSSAGGLTTGKAVHESLAGKQDVANITQDMSGSDFGSTTKYPSVKAVQDAITTATSSLTGVEYTANKVTTMGAMATASTAGTHIEYPSAKVVYDNMVTIGTNQTVATSQPITGNKDFTGIVNVPTPTLPTP